ncbi:short transient receptor potential channel 7-like [Lytechinus variegatus]|uniref:short transient receptor potential channel 7-like n=1 Tax=Lytechinus variegatus TaxID=7654 RepID=UPI001BB169DE|nr:short transient receptor potential channel 7-like [Lytechinus variegatus]
MEWKFGRAQLWLRVIEAKTDLPPPFNLIPKSGTVLRMIKRCVGKTPRSSEEDEARSEDGDRAGKVTVIHVPFYNCNSSSTNNNYNNNYNNNKYYYSAAYLWSGHKGAPDIIRKLLERYQDQRRASTPSSGLTVEDLRILKEDFRSLRNHISKTLRWVEMSIASLEDIVQGLNLRIDELEDTDTQLDSIDRNRVQIEDDDIDQLIEDVTIFEKCVRRAMARLQSTSLITQMAEMYTQGRTVVNDEEMRGKLESYRKDFGSYEKNLYA